MSGHTHEIDQLALSHGQARWILQGLDLHAGEDDHTFDSYIKSLRRDGVPFARDELGVGAGHNLKYQYVHMMELAVALALRNQAILSRYVVGLLVFYRLTLRALYRQAWLERESERGAPRDVIIPAYTGGGKSVFVSQDLAARALGQRLGPISGTFLDLQLMYGPNGVLDGPPPRLLGPVEALELFMPPHRSAYPRAPLPVSWYALMIVRLAKDAPELKRGRRS